MNPFSELKLKGVEKFNGFAIPQILILGIGIAVSVTGLISASILGLTGSRISRQELLAKSSSYSGISRLRSLFNDNSKGRLFNYFWIVNNCSEEANECDFSYIANPSSEYWSDDSWCNGEENCNGRQKAPYCPTETNISWQSEQEIVSNLFRESNFLGSAVVDSEKDFNQYFKIISSKYIGTEEYGINSILIEGIARPINSSIKSASNKLRVNIQVNGVTSESGFGFISVGENNSDKLESLYLGNINFNQNNNSKGSIIWRMNIENNDNCGNFIELAKANNASLPSDGNGGLWVQPLVLPKQPRLKNVRDIGTLICTSENYAKENTNCKLDSGDSSEKTFRIYSLFARGPGSKFEVSTEDNKKIILEIMGDIDISNEGKFCHRDGLNPCGSGKPQNLTILFKQKSESKENKLVCNKDSDFGGVKLNNNFSYNAFTNFNNDLLPGHTFLIDNTGENFSEKFGAFVYGPKITLLSTRPKSNWVQIHNNEQIANNSGLIVISRGVYGYIANVSGDSVEDTITNLILTSDFKLIPYSSENDVNNFEIIGVGEKISSLPANSQFDSSISKVFLIYDNFTSNYHLRGFDSININRLNNSNLLDAYPGSFAILRPKNNQNDINLGNTLSDNSSSNIFLSAFNIKVKARDNYFDRNFSGAAWVKNLCFDNLGDKNWEFSKNFIDELVSWHGNQFNWGVKYYRGRSIILWDTLRDFGNN